MPEPGVTPTLEVITGPMFAGKTTELLRRIALARLAGLNVAVFRPATDTRSPACMITARGGARVDAVPCASASDMLASVEATTSVVAIDEAQFFDEELESVVPRLLQLGQRVIVAGLDLDFAGRPFGPMPRLLALADRVDKLTAVCMRCHAFGATRTQRLVDGAPASGNTPVIVVDAGEETVTYQARCRPCYRPPVPNGPVASAAATVAGRLDQARGGYATALLAAGGTLDEQVRDLAQVVRRLAANHAWPPAPRTPAGRSLAEAS